MGSNVDSATIRATAQRVVDAWSRDNSQRPLSERLVEAGADLAAQSHATALADAEREAARRALDALADEQASPRDGLMREPLWHGDIIAFRDRYLAREHPAPAPRECVDVKKPYTMGWVDAGFRKMHYVDYNSGRIVGWSVESDYSTACGLYNPPRPLGDFFSRDKASEAVEKAFATTEGAR